METEGFALVMLCQCRPLARRLVVHILRESRAILRLINQEATAQQQQQQQSQSGQEDNTTAPTTVAASSLPVIDILDGLAPAILERILPLLPPSERVSRYSAPSIK